ncbi:MAG: patatin-like phospholipase family protein [Acidobacteria bacterium]|nr:patatin-like phospholipase family protein [Acidobacteriota bacterium]
MDVKGLGEELRRTLRRIRDFAYARLPRREGERPRLGLALGGGFARGIAHIGVLKVLEENGLRPDYLAGTSVGSIIAGGYAGGASTEELTRVARRVRWKDFARWTVSRMGLASNERMETFIRRYFRALQFEDLQIPLAVVATDLVHARAVVFTSGDLATALRASCAYPGLFQPIVYNGSLLADGGLVWSVPTKPVAELGADIVLAISLDAGTPPAHPKSLVEVIGQSIRIAQDVAEPIWREHADLIVEPVVGRYRWDDFERADELIRAGEAAMREALPQLRHLLAHAPSVELSSS